MLIKILKLSSYGYLVIAVTKFLQPIIFDQQTFSNQHYFSLLLLLNPHNIIDIVVISLVHEMIS